MGIVSATLLLSISISGFSGLAIPRVWLTRNARSGLRFRVCCSLPLCERVSGPFPLLHMTTSGISRRKANTALISSLALLCAYRPKSISEFISPPAPTRTPAPLTLTLDTAEDTEAGCTEGACTALGTGTVEGWGCRWEAGTGMGGWVAAWECESARRFPPALDDGGKDKY